MEETNYDRPPLEVIEQPAPLEFVEQPTLSPDKLANKNVADGEKDVGIETLHVEKVYSERVLSGKPKSFVQRMSILDKKRPFTVHIKIARILKLWSFPVILYAGFQNGCCLCWYNVFNATASLVLSSPPYNFTP
jgi:hypothetical protein